VKLLWYISLLVPPDAFSPTKLSRNVVLDTFVELTPFNKIPVTLLLRSELLNTVPESPDDMNCTPVVKSLMKQFIIRTFAPEIFNPMPLKLPKR